MMDSIGPTLFVLDIAAAVVCLLILVRRVTRKDALAKEEK